MLCYFPAPRPISLLRPCRQYLHGRDGMYLPHCCPPNMSTPGSRVLGIRFVFDIEEEPPGNAYPAHESSRSLGTRYRVALLRCRTQTECKEHGFQGCSYLAGNSVGDTSHHGHGGIAGKAAVTKWVLVRESGKA